MRPAKNQPPCWAWALCCASYSSFRCCARALYQSSRSSTGRICPWTMSTKVRCWAWGTFAAGSALAIVLLLGAWFFHSRRMDYRLFLTYARVKYIEGRELTCLDLSEDLWREVPACGGGVENNFGYSKGP